MPGNGTGVVKQKEVKQKDSRDVGGGEKGPGSIMKAVFAKELKK
jgi:hypothetical protein